jgi:hypothetical protein
MLAAHLQENEGPVSPFMEFVLEMVTIQFGIGIVIPDELRRGAGRDGEREADAFGIARGIIAQHLETQRRGDATAASTETR